MSTYLLDVEYIRDGELFPSPKPRIRVEVQASGDERAELAAMWTAGLAGLVPLRVFGVGP